MCANCRSSYQSQDFNDKPFGYTNDGSMADKGVAMKANTRYDGDNGQDEKFEGMAPGTTASAAEAQNSGRQ